MTMEEIEGDWWILKGKIKFIQIFDQVFNQLIDLFKDKIVVKMRFGMVATMPTLAN